MPRITGIVVKHREDKPAGGLSPLKNRKKKSIED
jgi:hypothetical protein